MFMLFHMPLALFGIDDAILYGILMVASTAASVGTSMYSSRKAAQAQEAVADANNDRAQRDAEQLRRERQQEARAERRDARRRRASIESRYAANGVLLQGSAADAIAEQGAVDELNILNRTRMIESRADSIDENGKLGLWEASLAASAKKQAGTMQAVSTVFSNAAAGYSGYQALK